MRKADTVQSSASTAPAPKRRIALGKLALGIGLVVLLLMVGVFASQATVPVEGGAMAPTFFEGQQLLAYRFAYASSQPQRGDIVVYPYPENPQFDFVHRVIGLPGETVTVRDERVYINDTRLEEPYLRGVPIKCLGGSVCSDEPVVVPDDHIFLMADNRASAIDSRVYGPVSLGMVKGRVWLITAPQEDFGPVPRPTYDL